jgi:hypothetical protein
VSTGRPRGQGEDALVLGLREHPGRDPDVVERIGAAGVEVEGLAEARVRSFEAAPRGLGTRQDDPGLHVGGLRLQPFGGEGRRPGVVPAMEGAGVFGHRERRGGAGSHGRLGQQDEQKETGEDAGHRLRVLRGAPELGRCARRQQARVVR